jgi:gas vesicle protein
MEETLTECPECHEESLVRVLPYVAYNTTEKVSKVGDVVKRSIKEAKEAMVEDRKQSSKEYKS